MGMPDICMAGAVVLPYHLEQFKLVLVLQGIAFLADQVRPNKK